MVLKQLPENEEADLILWADGGTIGGSPGTGVYWSIGNDTQGVVRYRDESGSMIRSDEAEYLALKAALQLMLHVCQPGQVAVVHMDCRPIVWHIKTQHKPRNKRLRSLYWDVQELLARLDENGVDVVFRWVPRRKMVEILGH